MGDIIRFPEDRHEETQLLLPWYVTGRLDAAERMGVDAHLAQCGECREALAIERRLRRELPERTPGVEHGWEALRGRLDGMSDRPAAASVPPLPAQRSARRRGVVDAARRATAPAKLKWLVAAQFACIVVLGAGALTGGPRQGAYRVLGDAPGAASAAANAIVMFRPDAREEELRRALDAGGARLVGGPTAAGAWVIALPAERRDALLGRLRRDGAVTLAEAVDPLPSGEGGRAAAAR